jgi:sec-independent protein translocase protein TatA
MPPEYAPMALGQTEILIIVGLFFLLFGIERVPKLARAFGQAKAEFHQGLKDGGDVNKAEGDLDRGGRTETQALIEDAEAKGVETVGKSEEQVADDIAAADVDATDSTDS